MTMPSSKEQGLPDDALSNSGRVLRARSGKVAAVTAAQSHPNAKAEIADISFRCTVSDDLKVEPKADPSALFRRCSYAAGPKDEEEGDPLSQSGRAPRSRRRVPAKAAAKSRVEEADDPLSQSGRAPRARRRVPAAKAAPAKDAAQGEGGGGGLYARASYAAPSKDEEEDDPLSQSTRAPRSRRRPSAKLGTPAHPPMSLSDHGPRARPAGGGASAAGVPKARGLKKCVSGILSKSMLWRNKGSKEQED